MAICKKAQYEDMGMSFAQFSLAQYGHVEGNDRNLDGAIRHWIGRRIEDSLGLTSLESCNIEDVGSERVFARYIVDLHHLEQEIFIHFFITQNGLEITFLMWAEGDQEREGDPVECWNMSSWNDETAIGMAKRHLQLLEGCRTFQQIINLYK